MERRGRIPIAKFRTQEGKTRSRSRVREPDYNEQDPETDLFTLLEDNIALKEANKLLKSQLEESNAKQKLLQEESNKITKQLEQFKQQHEKLEQDLVDVTAQLNEMEKEKNALEKVQKIRDDESNLRQSAATGAVGFIACPKLKSKLLQILCAQAKDAKHDGIDLVDEDEALNNTALTIDLIEKLIDEFLTLKTNINAVELQLYEANEKMSDLLENQQHLEHENEVLRTENINLTKVAKLLTDNMKESVETSKKMEAALIKLKQRNDELMGKNRDRIDGLSNNNINTTMPSPSRLSITPATTGATTDINVQQINSNNNNNSEQIENQNQSSSRDQGERVVEMQNAVEAFAQTEPTSDSLREEELKSLKLQLQIMEAELREVTARAQLAECELEKYKLFEEENQFINSRNSLNKMTQSDSITVAKSVAPSPLPLPPPPPPPMPSGLLYKAYPLRLVGKKQTDIGLDEMTAYNANPIITKLDVNSNCSMTMINTEEASTTNAATTVAAAGAAGSSNNLRKTIDYKMKPEAATGVDALVRELKSGRVTLRRNRRKTHTNEALQEMFQVLEISQQQNRNSKICINLNS